MSKLKDFFWPVCHVVFVWEVVTDKDVEEKWPDLQ